MNTKLAKLVMGTIIFALGATVDHVYSSERYAEVFVTRSGTFLIRSNRIYETVELDSTYVAVDKGIMK